MKCITISLQNGPNWHRLISELIAKRLAIIDLLTNCLLMHVLVIDISFKNFDIWFANVDRYVFMR